MEDEDLCFLGAAAQAELVRSGEVTATKIVEATLARIASVNPTLNCYREVLAESALAEAAVIDKDPAGAGTLAGVPVAIKDTIAVRGSVTTSGTSGVHHPEEVDAPVVAALRSAGAIIVGKTTCSELAVWPFTETQAWGQTRNPWNPEYTPGGSSGGAGAAMAAGLCGLAVGSDGLGSIRVPSSFNGVFGIKPHYGRVWHKRYDWLGMAVNGPVTRTVADAALFLDAASIDPHPGGFVSALTEPGERLRIALAWKSAAVYPLAATLKEDQRQAVLTIADVLRDLGHDVFEQEVGFPQSMSNAYLFRYLAGVHESTELLDEIDSIDKRTKQMARFGRMLPASSVKWAIGNEAKAAAKVNRIFERADVVLTPGPVEAPLRVGQLDGKGAIASLYASGRKIPHFAPWNMIGHPAVSVPAGLSPHGLPVSVQLAGRAHDEATLLRLSAQLESAHPWAHMRPPL